MATTATDTYTYRPITTTAVDWETGYVSPVTTTPSPGTITISSPPSENAHIKAVEKRVAALETHLIELIDVIEKMRCE